MLLYRVQLKGTTKTAIFLELPNLFQLKVSSAIYKGLSALTLQIQFTFEEMAKTKENNNKLLASNM